MSSALAVGKNEFLVSQFSWIFWKMILFLGFFQYLWPIQTFNFDYLCVRWCRKFIKISCRWSSSDPAQRKWWWSGMLFVEGKKKLRICCVVPTDKCFWNAWRSRCVYVILWDFVLMFKFILNCNITV